MDGVGWDGKSQEQLPRRRLDVQSKAARSPAYFRCMGSIPAVDAATIHQATERLTMLVKALRDYGHHRDNCSRLRRPMHGHQGEDIYRPCDCGLAKALGGGA